MYNVVIYDARQTGSPVRKSEEKVSDLKKYFWLRSFGLFETAVIECAVVLPDDHWMRVIVEDDG